MTTIDCGLARLLVWNKCDDVKRSQPVLNQFVEKMKTFIYSKKSNCTSFPDTYLNGYRFVDDSHPCYLPGYMASSAMSLPIVLCITLTIDTSNINPHNHSE